MDTKSKQIQQWIEKKYKVQVTIKKAKNAEEPENKMVSKNSSNCFLFADLNIKTKQSNSNSVSDNSFPICFSKCKHTVYTLHFPL